MTTPMSAERFADRFRFYRDQPQQQRGVQQLFEAIAGCDQGTAILDEQAPWAVTFSEQPPQPPAPAGGLDPRGSEEVGMVGPQKPAPVQPGDSYLLVNDWDEDMEAYDHTGRILWKIPCLTRGQGADTDWSHANTDTPPGLYKLGKLNADYEQNPNPPCSDTAMGYGWYSFDMEELEGQEVEAQKIFALKSLGRDNRRCDTPTPPEGSFPRSAPTAELIAICILRAIEHFSAGKEPSPTVLPLDGTQIVNKSLRSGPQRDPAHYRGRTAPCISAGSAMRARSSLS